MLVRIVLIQYVLMSVVCFVMFASDKRRAMRGKRRIPERSLHSMELIGGWPGALLAARCFQHKVRKRSYMWTLYAIACAHLVLFMLLFWAATRP